MHTQYQFCKQNHCQDANVLIAGQTRYVFVFHSIGCGIGYGYLHRIPLRDEAHRSKEAPVITPASDGFSEVYVQ